MALRHAAVFRTPGSYVASPASSLATLIWRRSTARIVPSWMGSSYVLPVRLSVTDRVLFDTRIVLGNGWGKITRGRTVKGGASLYRPLPSSIICETMPPPAPAKPASPKPAPLYPTRAAAGALLGQQLAGRGYLGCLLLGITPEGVEIAANAAKAMGAQFDVLVAAFIKLGSNLAPIGAIAESAPSEMDPDFQPSGALMDKLASAIDESRARVSQDLILYRTERPVKRLAGRIAVIIDGQVTYPWRVLAAAKVAEQLGATQIVIATPVATQAAADRIAARRYDFVCPSIVMDAQGHPAPYGDVAGETPERLRSIMIAHQAA